MSKKKKSKCDMATIALATAILNLMITIIDLIEKIIN